MIGTADEAGIRNEAAQRSANESIARARAGQEVLEETLNDCIYHAELRAAGHALSEAEDRVLEGARKAIHSRDRAQLEASTLALCEHYAYEIGGHFDPRVYAFASRLAPRFFSLLLSAQSLPKLLVEGFRVEELQKRLVISGEVSQLTRLAELGTVMCTPTHGSHMDSLVMAYALQLAELPPFIYGAGKNLFSNKLMSFFMQNLGGYKVDRLKGEALYKRTLKNYCVATLSHGLPNLFFPGGTRSRSGAIEAELKLGLLGCGLEAYIENLRASKAKPNVFFIPATVSYHLVLEAETLIEDFLKDEGKSRFIIEDDEFSRPERIVRFITALFAMDGQIHVRFGRALDPFGNQVDSEGRSLDPHGRVIDATRYAHDAHGEPALDRARDRQYTRELGAAIVSSLRANNTILPTHVTCFALMHAMVERSGERDLYRVLRSDKYKDGFSTAELVARVAELLHAVRALSAQGRLHWPSSQADDAVEVVAQAEHALSLYHVPPAVEHRGERLFVGDPKLVYYYHNRLTGYGLDSHAFLVPRARKGNRK
jgi:glycerol-3-phosphate O-acyltransferase